MSHLTSLLTSRYGPVAGGDAVECRTMRPRGKLCQQGVYEVLGAPEDASAETGGCGEDIETREWGRNTNDRLAAAVSWDPPPFPPPSLVLRDRDVGWGKGGFTVTFPLSSRGPTRPGSKGQNCLTQKPPHVTSNQYWHNPQLTSQLLVL